MKKNTMMRVASALLVAVLLTTCAISGTFAKYVSTATAEDSARVAKWSFEVGAGNDIATATSFTFDLFKTIKDTDGTAEDDISPADGTIIAPGTQGSFDIVLNNKSEVTANYAIDYTVENTSNIPVQFSVDNGATWSNTLADVVASTDTELAATNGTKTVTVQWKWTYSVDEAGDTADTTLGIGGTAVLKVTAAITATQVD